MTRDRRSARLRSLLCAACAVLALASAGSAGEIGIYASPDCSGCTIAIPPRGGTGTVYVNVLNDGSPPIVYGQVCGASFRITGLPELWFADVRSSPDHAVAGDPFGPEGSTILFYGDGCSAGRCVNLFTVTLTVIVPRSDVHPRVAPGPPTHWPGFDCPRVHFPNGPIDPQFQCYPGGEILVNPENDPPCTVSVATRTWSGVRSLYRKR
jgi:hypothetical protein